MVTVHERAYEIRSMEPRDILQVSRLENQVFADPWPESAYIQELYFNPEAHYFVLQLRDTALVRPRWPLGSRRLDRVHGYVGMRVEERCGHISTLAVHPNVQGMGFGELLLITALESAIATSATSVELEVRVTNKVAQNLYSKYNFEVTARLRRYYRDGTDAFLMEVVPLDRTYQRMIKKYRRETEARIARSLAEKDKGHERRNHGFR